VLDLHQLLRPFLSAPLSEDQLHQLQLYLNLLLKWNTKINLTAIRNPEEIVRRHFGESLFAGEQLQPEAGSALIDMGSGAGFPGLPIKILAPQTEVTLIESQQKKVAFLREAIRTLGVDGVSVHAGRAEGSQVRSQIVTLRAIEKFESAVPVAASLLEPRGRLALLIGASQAQVAHKQLPAYEWQEPIAIPNSRERILLVGSSTALADEKP
jgi:16S rRNA (guanine527-N7)-methyltransferase